MSGLPDEGAGRCVYRPFSRARLEGGRMVECGQPEAARIHHAPFVNTVGHAFMAPEPVDVGEALRRAIDLAGSESGADGVAYERDARDRLARSLDARTGVGEAVDRAREALDAVIDDWCLESGGSVQELKDTLLDLFVERETAVREDERAKAEGQAMAVSPRALRQLHQSRYRSRRGGSETDR